MSRWLSQSQRLIRMRVDFQNSVNLFHTMDFGEKKFRFKVVTSNNQWYTVYSLVVEVYSSAVSAFASAVLEFAWAVFEFASAVSEY